MFQFTPLKKICRYISFDGIEIKKKNLQKHKNLACPLPKFAVERFNGSAVDHIQFPPHLPRVREALAVHNRYISPITF